jgi:uncharacterized protein (DUF1501 family)
MLRRDFLKTIGFVSAGSVVSQLGAMQARADDAGDFKALVCVFLFGGNDGNNMIVPVDARYDSYARMRDRIALSKESLIALTDANGSVQFGMHPGLSRLRDAWSSGHLAMVLNSGPLLRPVTREQLLAGASRPTGLFSHADQQRTWQTVTSSASQGWGGRLADEFASANYGAKVPGVIAIAGDAVFTTARTGALVLPTSGGLVLRGTDASAASGARKAALEQMLIADKNFELIAAAQEITSGALERRSAVNGIVNGSSAAVATAFKGLTSTLSKQLATVAKLIQRNAELGMRRQIFFIGMGGFDTHSGQLGTQNALLTQLGGALGAFYSATLAMGKAHQVTTFTMSDFARTMRVNTVQGTDHAWGNHHLILGGAVRGQTLYGQYPELVAGGPDDFGEEGRWIPTTSVDQYAATLAAWFGVAAADLTKLFPNLSRFQSANLGFLA